MISKVKNVGQKECNYSDNINNRKADGKFSLELRYIQNIPTALEFESSLTAYPTVCLSNTWIYYEPCDFFSLLLFLVD